MSKCLSDWDLYCVNVHIYLNDGYDLDPHEAYRIIKDYLPTLRELYAMGVAYCEAAGDILDLYELDLSDCLDD